MTTALVPYLDWYVMKLALDPCFQADLRRLEAKVLAVQAGIESADEAFGPSLGIDALDRRYPGLPRRYPLLDHLHWMGGA